MMVGKEDGDIDNDGDKDDSDRYLKEEEMLFLKPLKENYSFTG